MKLIDRAKYVLKGEDGAVSVEMVGMIAVVLVILLALFFFRDSIRDAIGRGASQVDGIDFGDGKSGLNKGNQHQKPKEKSLTCRGKAFYISQKLTKELKCGIFMKRNVTDKRIQNAYIKTCKEKG